MFLKLIKFLIFSVLVCSTNICISNESLKNLSDLSRYYTKRFLKNGYSTLDVQQAINFIKKQKKLDLYIYKFSRNKWKMSAILNKDNSMRSYSKVLLYWLNEHATSGIKEGFSFVCLPVEPIHENSFLTDEVKNKLKQIYAKCPIFATCTHPDIPWTENAILIPDFYILNENYKINIDNILNRNIVLFNERKPIIFFRGAVTGPYSATDFNTESILKNKRLLLFMKSKNNKFIDAGITSDGYMLQYAKSTPAFLEWYKLNLKDEKSSSADFIEHAKYKYLISLDGFGAAWSRVPYILFTGSVLLLRADCKQYFYKLLTPKVTHFDIKPGLDDLEDVYKYLEKNPKIAKNIGQNGFDFAEKYLTKKAVDAYLKQVIHDLNEAYKQPTWFEQMIFKLKNII
ncbi:MAG: glycosyl transferase family 90 [Candidatus Paracaedibacteraceae bacterium]|nr:glycosyl transferase family 90 [Candidatus Paracaedibacteraceae bacterium]